MIRCWKYLAIIFRRSDTRNYAKEAVLLLNEFFHLLSPHQADQLIFNRFINTSGLPGRNISCDLMMEHLNKVLKDCIGHLKAGKTEKANYVSVKPWTRLHPFLKVLIKPMRSRTTKLDIKLVVLPPIYIRL